MRLHQAQSSSCNAKRVKPHLARFILPLNLKPIQLTAVILEIRALVLNGATAGSISTFDYYLYSIVQTDNTQTQNRVYSVTGVSPSPSTALVATSTAVAPTFIEAEYVPYKELINSQPSGTYGEIVFKYTLTQTLSNANQIVISLTNSFLTFGGSIETVAGDFSTQAAIIIMEPTDLASSNGQILVTATYSAPTLTFNLPSGVTLSSGHTPTFKITQVAQTKNYAYVGPASNIASGAAYASEVILQIYSDSSSTTPLLTGQVGTLFPQFSNIAVSLTPVLSRYLTAAAGATNALEITLNTATSIDNFFIDFPNADDAGNAVWSANLGSYTDNTRIPCIIQSTLVDCIFFQGSGTQARPSRIQVKGYGTTLSGITILYIIGMTNPNTIGTYLYADIRYYSGTTFKQISRIAGFKTIASTIANVATADDTNYPVTVNKIFGARTYTFKTAVAIPTNSMILVKLDPSCTLSIIAASYTATGAIGAYLLRITSSAISADSTYTTNAIACSNVGLAFTEYHMSSPSGGTGEVRSANLILDPPTKRSAGFVSISSSAFMYSGIPEGITGLSYKLSLSLTSFLPIPITAGYVMTIEFFGLYFDTYASCQYVGGLTAIPGQAIGCATTSSGISITNFKGIDTTNFIVMITYKSGSSYSGGQAIIKFFASSAQQAADDFATYSSIPYSTFYNKPTGLITMANMPFTNVPAPGVTGPITINIADSTYAVDSTTVPTGTAFNIFFDLTESILKASTTCAVTSGASYAATCTIDTTNQIVKTTFSVASPITITFLPGIVIALTNAVMPLNAAAYIYRIEVGPQTAPLLSTSIIADTLMGTTATMSATALHQMKADYNEYAFSVTTPAALSGDKGFSFQYTGFSLRQPAGNQIDCICMTSSALAATCYNYGGTAIDVFITASASSAIKCFVPDISQATASTVTITANIMNLGSRTAYYQTIIPPIPLTTSTASSHTLEVTYPTNTLTASASETVTTKFKSTPGYAANSAFYVDFGSGLIPPCTGLLTACRAYSTVRNIIVKTYTTAQAAGTITLFSSSVTYPSAISETNTNYTFNSFVATANAIITTSSVTSSPVSNYYPVPTTLTAALLGTSNLGLPNLIRLTTSAFTTSIPYTVSGVGALIKITVKDFSNFGSSCYASSSAGGPVARRYTLPCTVSSTSSPATFTITNPDAKIIAGDSLDLYFYAKNPTTPCKSDLLSLF